MTPMLVSNQPVRNNKVKLPCSRKQQELLMDFELTADPLRVIRANNNNETPIKT